ncbi:MAG: shikimate kinase [Gemmatimonadota bacterium]
MTEGGAGRRERDPDARRGETDGGDLPPRIVLVGFMAAGKSTVGRRVAERAGYPFLDLDDEVEEMAGRSIPELFRREGEEAFREMEAEVTRRADDVRPAVIAAGGGWMARPELADRWEDAARVWLRVSPEAVLERIGDDLSSRPMLDPGSPLRSIRAILEARRPQYARAEHEVATDGRTPEEVAEAVLAAVRRG